MPRSTGFKCFLPVLHNYPLNLTYIDNMMAKKSYEIILCSGVSVCSHRHPASCSSCIPQIKDALSQRPWSSICGNRSPGIVLGQSPGTKVPNTYLRLGECFGRPWSPALHNHADRRLACQSLSKLVYVYQWWAESRTRVCCSSSLTRQGSSWR